MRQFENSTPNTLPLAKQKAFVQFSCSQGFSPVLARTRPRGSRAEHGSFCPGTSDVDFLGDLRRVVDLNAEVVYGAFDPRVAE